MYGTQTIVNSLTPQQIADMVEEAVKRGLKNYVLPVEKPPTLPEYPSRRQTKEFLGVSYTTLNLWSKDTAERPAILVPRKIGARIRYNREDVLAALKESRRFHSTSNESA